MSVHLVVVRPFSDLTRGDIVANPARISEILEGENALHVVRVHADPRDVAAETKET